MLDVSDLAFLQILGSSCVEGLVMSFVNFCVAVLLKELLSLLLHFLGHKARTLGPDVKQDEAAFQHVWERPGLKDDTGINRGLQRSCQQCLDAFSISQALAHPSASHPSEASQW